VSWITLNEMLGLATVNPKFQRELLAEPVAAAHAWGFDLTSSEESVLRNIVAHNLQDFSQAICAFLSPDDWTENKD